MRGRHLLLLWCALAQCITTSNPVQNLPGMKPLDQTAYSGFFEVNQEYGAHLFYYFVESQGNPKTDPLVLWLQGGPGCSSLFGSFVENGPQLINLNGSFTENKFSWNAKANMLWIDQPVGSGYSYVESVDGYVTNEKTMAVELYSAITQFLTLYPEYNNNFYIFGESYAGKYIPSLAHYVLEQNKQNPKVPVKLQGLGIGDGWVDPYYQTGSYAPFLYKNNLIDEVALELASITYQGYKGLVDVGAWIAADEVGNALLETLVEAAGGVDVYDIRYTNDPTDPLGDALNVYLNTPSVMQALNAGNQGWSMCGSSAYFGLLDDVEQSVANLLPDLLANYQVMNYNGDKDLICNLIGTTEWTQNLDWPGQNAYNTAKTQNWTVAGNPAGYYKYGGNLSHVIVFNAGHMAPFNQPQNTQDLLYRFIANGFRA